MPWELVPGVRLASQPGCHDLAPDFPVGTLCEAKSCGVWASAGARWEDGAGRFNPSLYITFCVRDLGTVPQSPICAVGVALEGYGKEGEEHI